jgi:trehalose/maltose hydrolase-like predicted phosphorylase
MRKQFLVVEYINDVNEWGFYALYDSKKPIEVLKQVANEMNYGDDEEITVKQEFDGFYTEQCDFRAYFTNLLTLK